MDPMSPVASEIAIASDTNPRPRQRARRDPRGANTRGNLDVDAHVRVLNPRLGDVALVDVDDVVRVVKPMVNPRFVEVLHGEAALDGEISSVLTPYNALIKATAQDFRVRKDFKVIQEEFFF